MIYRKNGLCHPESWVARVLGCRVAGVLRMRERPKEIVSVISKGAGTGVLFCLIDSKQQTRKTVAKKYVIC